MFELTAVEGSIALSVLFIGVLSGSSYRVACLFIALGPHNSFVSVIGPFFFQPLY